MARTIMGPSHPEYGFTPGVARHAERMAVLGGAMVQTIGVNEKREIINQADPSPDLDHVIGGRAIRFTSRRVAGQPPRF
jgi:hypothetical protein